jgi:hypothetical protein
MGLSSEHDPGLWRGDAHRGLPRKITYRCVRTGRVWRPQQQPEKGSTDEAAETTINLESEY